MPGALRICLDARLEDGMAGGIQQFIMGLAGGLSSLEDGPEEYLFLARPGSTDWLKPFIRGRCRFLYPREADGSAGISLGCALKNILPSTFTRGFARSFFPVRVPPSDGTAEAAGARLMHFTVQSGFVTDLPSIYQPYDLQHAHLPGFFSRMERKWRDTTYRVLCHQARKVVVMSRWGKQDVVQSFGVEPEKVQVINWAPVTALYPAPVEKELADARKRLDLPGAFLLYPAQTFPHKNHAGLLEALALLRKKGLEIPAILPGTLNEHYPRLREKAARLGLERAARFIGYVRPLDLQCLYRLGRMMVFPSLFEGGGMPVFEAFHAGLPVACSNVTCLPEQAGGAALLFDPRSPEAMAQAIEKLWNGEELRQELAHKGRERVEPFTWERMARTYRALYRQMAGQPLLEEEQALLDENRMI